jgi:hypothetical protein
VNVIAAALQAAIWVRVARPARAFSACDGASTVAADAALRVLALERFEAIAPAFRSK